MKSKLCGLLLLVGSLFLAEGSFSNPRRNHHPVKVADKALAKKLNSQHEKSIDDSWQRITKQDAEPPSFVADSFENSTITGKIMITFHNRTIYAFQGFRFGEGERFKPPKPVDKFWKGGNFNATHIGFKCPQGAAIGDQPAGNEDCLYLNVYTPFLPPSNKKLPVMLFIHGGSFVSGDASYYMPTRLLDHDVILITIHYRMGAFGFFTLNNEEAPGNIALYDMVEALQWTQRHIADFGGDPDKVTVQGESAGSVAANYMLIVEPANGLFRAVIAESGSCFDHWALDEDPTYATQYLANYVGCNYGDDTEILNCMRKVPMEDLVHAEGSLTSSDKHMGLMGFRGASPTVQKFSLSNDSYYDLILDDRPIEYFKNQRFSMVPFLTGANKDEGSFVVGIMYDDYVLYHQLEKNKTYLREQMIQDLLGAIGVSDDPHALATSLQNLYCPGIDLANLTAAAPCLVDLAGVMFLKAGSWEVADYHSYYFDENATYYYSFEFMSDDSLFAFTGLPFDGGVTHADDLLYLFSMPAVMDYPGQVKTVDRLTTLWTNFATYLNPTPEDQKDALMKNLELPIWPPYMFEDHHVLVISDDVTVEKEFSDRWTISIDELNPKTAPPETCTGQCADYKDQRDSFEAVMITFIVLFVVVTLVAIYFFFKART